MFLNKKSIIINSPPDKVFDVIETMPNKFPVYRILEAKPFFFLRLLFTDGFKTARKVRTFNKPENSYILNIGDRMGPFRLSEAVKPFKYWFSVESFFINCGTGYLLTGENNITRLNFDITAENFSFKEKVYWSFIKPVHSILAGKSLKIIKEKAENN